MAHNSILSLHESEANRTGIGSTIAHLPTIPISSEPPKTSISGAHFHVTFVEICLSQICGHPHAYAPCRYSVEGLSCKIDNVHTTLGCLPTFFHSIAYNLIRSSYTVKCSLVPCTLHIILIYNNIVRSI